MSIQHEKDVLKVLDILIGVIREAKSDKQSTYMLNMKEDPDNIVAKADAILAQMHDDKKLDRELRIVDMSLHSGKCVVFRAEAKDANNPAGQQGCHDKIKALLMGMANRRKYKDDQPGRVCGHSAEQIDAMTAEQLEDFRKVVCNQRYGGVQLENKVLYHLGSGNTNFVHQAIGTRFKEAEALYKDPGLRRTYWFSYKKEASVATIRKDAVREVKTRAEHIAKKAAEKAAAKKLAAKKAAEKVAVKESEAEADPAVATAEPVTEGVPTAEAAS